MPIDNGAMLAQQRQLLGQADQHRAQLWDAIGNTISFQKSRGVKPAQIMKTLAPVLGPLRKLTISSGRDDLSISPELAGLFARPVAPPQPAPVQSAPAPIQQAAPDFHLNDISDSHIDAAIDKAFEGLGV